MAAACLARLGINFKIIDQRLPGETAGHADGIQPRTVEIWDSLGMGEELRRVGRQVYRTVTYEGTDDKSGIKKSGDVRNVSVDGARYPFEVATFDNLCDGGIDICSGNITSGRDRANHERDFEEI